MYDKALVIDILSQIIKAVETTEERCEFAICKDNIGELLEALQDIREDLA